MTYFATKLLQTNSTIIKIDLLKYEHMRLGIAYKC